MRTLPCLHPLLDTLLQALSACFAEDIRTQGAGKFHLCFDPSKVSWGSPKSRAISSTPNIRLQYFRILTFEVGFDTRFCETFWRHICVPLDGSANQYLGGLLVELLGKGNHSGSSTALG